MNYTRVPCFTCTLSNKCVIYSLFLATAVFVAPDLRVYMIPDIIPMLVKMQGAMGDGSFHPRYEDSRAISELFKLLIPPTINQNQSWVRREGERERDFFLNILALFMSSFWIMLIYRGINFIFHRSLLELTNCCSRLYS